jgi:hypothetical protein
MDRTVTVSLKLLSGHESQMGLDTKTDCQSTCGFDFDLPHKQHSEQLIVFLVLVGHEVAGRVGTETGPGSEPISVKER